MLSFQTISILSIALIIWGIYYYMSKNDEIPVILALFNIVVGVARYNLIQSGEISYVRVNYTMNIFNLNDEKAIDAMTYILIGTFVLMLFYTIYSKKYRKVSKESIDDELMLSYFLQTHKNKIILGFFVFLGLNAVISGSGSGPMALGSGYINLFKMALGGFILLLGTVLISGKLTPNQRFIILACLLLGMYFSYSPSSRFVFLSWAIGLSFFVFKDMRPQRKLRYLIPAFIGILLFFSLMGVSRERNLSSLTFEEKVSLSTERLLVSEDVNMLDGFMMVLDVYPERLNYHYGMEHIEILLRPIPRSIWPNKPLGGYANKLGLNDVTQGTVGISQTIYGSFFGEGGVLGIIIFSILYAKLLAWLLFQVSSYSSNIRFLVKGVVIASLIPLLRGGDLPGIYAFIGMSFWPVFIFLYYYRKFVKSTADDVEEDIEESDITEEYVSK